MIFKKHIITLGLSLFLTGCSSKPPCPEPLTDIDYLDATSSANLVINTYINSSLYMKGFVNASDKYRDLIDKISNLPVQMSSISRHGFFKFNKDGIKAFDNKNFLINSTYTNQGLAIDKIFLDKSYSKNNLNVVVTDFSQKLLDSNYSLVNNLTSQYITKGLSVGLISLKVPFKGEVSFDGVSKAYNYQGNKNLFIMVMGKYGDVKKYFLELKSNSSLHLNYSDLTIFSHHIIYHKLDFDRIPKDNYKIQSVPDNSFEEADQLLDCDKLDSRVKQYVLAEGNESLKIEKTLEFEKFEYTPDFKNIKADLKIQKFDEVDKKFVELDSKSKRLFNILGYQLQNNPKSKTDLFTTQTDLRNIRVKSIPAKSIPLSAKILIDIQSKELSSNTYRLKMDLYPTNLNQSGGNITEKNYTYNTISDYNKLSLSEVQKDKCLSNSSGSNCGLTLNLSSFTDSILSSMEYKENKSGKQLFNDKKLNVGQFYYYFKKP